jgi:LPS export ABC transporter protein LptC
MKPIRNQELTNKEIERWYRLRNLRNAAQALAIITILTLVGGYAVSRLIMERPDQTDSQVPTDAGNEGSQLSYSVPGPHPFHVKADRARMLKSGNKIQLTSPVITYYPKRGGDMVLKADTGELNQTTQNYSVKGNVTVTYDTFRIDAEELSYSHKNGLVSTSSAFTVTSKDMVLQGKRLKLLTDKKEVVVEQGVSAKLYNVKIFKNHNKSLAQNREKLP